MAHEVLVSTDWVAQNLGEPGVKLIDPNTPSLIDVPIETGVKEAVA